MDVKHLPLLDKDLAMNKTQYEEAYKANEALRNKVQQDPWRLHYHLMPESGWLNDPNGLCQYHGVYHIYYQYSPFDVDGKTKLWGHMTTKDMLNFKQEEPVLFPDSRVDERGVYSGSAFVEDDVIHYFYTGNVKLFDQEYDYINQGREQNTIHVESRDGYHFSDKEWLMSNKDYPEDMSCHIRDPKIYKKDGIYYMVLGARDLSSKGCVLVYESKDLKNWSYLMRLSSQQDFGYMWECPDLFDLDDQQFLITCPQGVAQEGYRFANVHQCGYFPVSIDFKHKTCEFQEFHELDYGFDFYAPQSFEDEKGRRILIGWMGLPDIDYTNPTTEYGWQHALTIPRELKAKDGVIYQSPIEELKELRLSQLSFEAKSLNEQNIRMDCYELEIHVEKNTDFVLQLRKGADISFDVEQELFTLSFEACGYGRTSRSAKINDLKNIRIYADTSSFEIFINDGSTVFTSRVYSDSKDNQIQLISGVLEANLHFYELGSIRIQ